MKLPLLLSPMDAEQIARLKALWKSGRDKYRSFFTVLNEVRQEVGEAALPRWCYENLNIGLSVILEYAKLLGPIDEKIVKANLAAARQAEKHQHRLEKARRATELAKARADKAAEDNRREKENHKGKTRKTDRKNTNKRGAKSAASRARRRVVSNISEADLALMIEKFKAADKMCERGEELWIEGSIAKATILCAARAKFVNDQLFGLWCSESGITVSHQDRAALIHLGGLAKERLKQIFTTTERRSYQYIWQDVSRLHVVGE